MSLFRDYSTMMKRGGDRGDSGSGGGGRRGRASRDSVRGGVGNPGARGGQTGGRAAGAAAGMDRDLRDRQQASISSTRSMQGAPAGVGSIDQGFSDNQLDAQAAAGDVGAQVAGGRDPLGGTDRAGRGDTLGRDTQKQATLGMPGTGEFTGSAVGGDNPAANERGGVADRAAVEATSNRQRAGADVAEEARDRGNGVVARQIGTGDVIRSGGASGVGAVVRPGLRPSTTQRSVATGRSRGIGPSRRTYAPGRRRRSNDEG